MRRGMNNTCELRFRRYSNHMINLNEYLSDFPGEKASEKSGETEFNDFFLNSIPNSWNKQAHVKGFDC